MPNAARPIISFLLVVLSVLGLMNVYGDNSDVENDARLVACPDCESTLTQVARTPIGQTFHLQTDKELVVVECARAGIFFGDYSCKKQGQ